MMYNISVYQSGRLINNLRLSAKNALEACNLAEKIMGIKPVLCTIGSSTRIVQWTGLEFIAKKV